MIKYTNIILNKICLISLFMILIGCSQKVDNVNNYTPQPIKITAKYVDCGDLKLKKLPLQKEDINEHPGSIKNQRIISNNLLLMHHKLKEAELIIQCYQQQQQKE